MAAEKRRRLETGEVAGKRANSLMSLTFEGAAGSVREGPFQPTFTHQVFEDEQVPAQVHAIKVCVSLQTATCVAEVDTDQGEEGSLAAEIRGKLRPALVQQAASTASAEFTAAVEPYGELAAHYEAGGARFEAWLGCPAQAVSHAQLAPRDHHARLQGLAQLFIDAASAIDLEDDRWRVLTLWARAGERAAVAGFATAFVFQNPVKGPSLRVCQTLILPPYQRQGHGVQLFRALQAQARREGCYALTVEDPGEDFTRLRDGIDLTDVCRGLGIPVGAKFDSKLQGPLAQHVATPALSPPEERGGKGAAGAGGAASFVYPRGLAARAKEKLLLSPGQATRVSMLVAYSRLCALRPRYASLAKQRGAQFLEELNNATEAARGAMGGNEELEAAAEGAAVVAVLQAARAHEERQGEEGTGPTCDDPVGVSEEEWEAGMREIRVAFKRRTLASMGGGKQGDSPPDQAAKDRLECEWRMVEGELAPVVVAVGPWGVAA